MRLRKLRQMPGIFRRDFHRSQSSHHLRASPSVALTSVNLLNIHIPRRICLLGIALLPPADPPFATRLAVNHTYNLFTTHPQPVRRPAQSGHSGHQHGRRIFHQTLSGQSPPQRYASTPKAGPRIWMRMALEIINDLLPWICLEHFPSWSRHF